MSKSNPKKNTGRGLIIGAVVVVAVLVAGGVVFAAKTLLQPKAPNYETATVIKGDIEDSVLATGSLQPADLVEVGSEVSGDVKTMHIKLGDHVKAGDLIAEINLQGNDRNQVQQAQSQINSAQANLNQARAQLNFQTTNLARNKTLLEKGAGTQVAVDQAENQIANARNNITQFEGQLRSSQATLDDAKARTDKANIRAPVDGMVAEIVTHQGETINIFRQVPIIARIAKMDVMTVRAQVSEADIFKVKRGQKVYFTLIGDANQRFYGTVRFIEPTPVGGVLDPGGGQGLPKDAIFYNVMFEVPNPDGVLFPAMTAHVHILLGEAKGVATVPLNTLGDPDAAGKRTVRVLQAGGKVVTRKVTVGLTDGTYAEIKDGLAPGEKVIVNKPVENSGEPKPLFGASPIPTT